MNPIYARPTALSGGSCRCRLLRTGLRRCEPQGCNFLHQSTLSLSLLNSRSSSPHIQMLQVRRTRQRQHILLRIVYKRIRGCTLACNGFCLPRLKRKSLGRRYAPHPSRDRSWLLFLRWRLGFGGRRGLGDGGVGFRDVYLFKCPGASYIRQNVLSKEPVRGVSSYCTALNREKTETYDIDGTGDAEELVLASWVGPALDAAEVAEGTAVLLRRYSSLVVTGPCSCMRRRTSVDAEDILTWD